MHSEAKNGLKEVVVGDINNLINQKPNRFIRFGNLILFIVLVGIILGAFLFKFPDKIYCPGFLRSTTPPIVISAKINGKLKHLYKQNGQFVSRGEKLALFESTTDEDQVLYLSRWADSAILFYKLDSTRLYSISIPHLDKLGELQDEYEAFYNLHQSTKQTLSNGYYTNKITSMKNEIGNLYRLYDNSIQKGKLQNEDKDLQKKELEAYRQLAKDKIIAPLELNQFESKYLAKEQVIKGTISEIQNIETNINIKRREVSDLEYQMKVESDKLLSTLVTLNNLCKKWIEEYFIYASDGGKLLILNLNEDNDWILTGQPVMYILPSNQDEFYCDLIISQNRFGKIKLGQKVVISLASYPSYEYGYITGIINNIPSLPIRNDSFLVKAILPNGLRTSLGKEIPFSNNLVLQTEVLTSNESLLIRIFSYFGKLSHK